MKVNGFARCFIMFFLMMPLIVASQVQQPVTASSQINATSSGFNSLLILCPQQWMDEVQPLADWKNQSGTSTVVVNVTPFANDATTIKNYIYSYFQQNPLTHVLIVGDNAFIATPFSVSTGAPSDPSYGYLSGNDSYPEVFTGRFPAENDSDVITMVQRTIQYEQSPDTSFDWFSKAAGIASNLGPGDDNEMDWEHLVNIRNQLLGYSYTSVAELYDGTQASTTDLPGNPFPSDVTSVLNSGISLLNYAGHGQNNSFNTSGFSVNEIMQLNNINHLPIVIAAGCTNGNFTNGSLCMGEVLLRARNNGQPVGAVAAFMSAVNQFWNPPMDAQDAMNAIITNNDSLLASTTFGGIVFGGCKQMNDNYGINGSLMTDSWHCFGDPSLVIRTKFPESVNVNHAQNIYTGDSVFNLTSLNENANVTLFQNGKLVSRNKVVNGICTLDFSPVFSTDSLLLTVSGYNLYPYQIKIPVLPSANAVIASSSQYIIDSAYNNNGKADFGELFYIDMVLNNAGLADFNSFTLSVYSLDSAISIVNHTTDTFSLNGLDSLYIIHALQVQVSDSVVDGHEAVIYIIVTDSSGNKQSFSFNLQLQAPQLILSSFLIDDLSGGNANGVGEAGESIQLKIACINQGGSDADYIRCILSSADPNITLLIDTITFQLQASSDTVILFPALISGSAPLNQLLSLNAVLISGSYEDDTVYTFTTGYSTDDFESASLSTFNWQFSGNFPWTISTVFPYEGLYCAQSGEIDDNETSRLIINVQVLRKDSIAFKYKTDCESVWDEFDFRVDSLSFFKASGITSWQHYSCLLDTGIHQLEFIYLKDNVFSAGADAVWIDEVRFPPSTIIQNIYTNLEKNSVTLFPNPASNSINISGDRSNASIRIFDATGRLHYNKAGVNRIDVTGFPAGFYMLLVQQGNAVFKTGFIVQH